MSRACKLMELRHVQQRLKICIVCRAYSMMVKCVCGVSLKDRRCCVDLYSLKVMISDVLLLIIFQVFRVWLVCWGVADGDGTDMYLGRKCVRCKWCRLVEMWWWQGWSVWAGAERLGDDMKLLELQPEWAIFGDIWKDFRQGANI